MQRTLISDIKNHIGKEVFLQGWVHSIRGQSKIKFLQLRDMSGVVQAVIADSALFDAVAKLLSESVISITGLVKKATVKSDEVTEKEIEIEAEQLGIINLAEPLPITIFEKDDAATQDLSKRLDYRFLDFHRRKTQAVFKIQSLLATAFMDYFTHKGFIQMQPPCLISSSSEGGADLFTVQYFEKKACLAQSPQLYKQMLACSMEKVVMVTPVWRAEKHNTPRHINEIRQMDIEAAFYDMFGIMKLEEEALQHLVKTIIVQCKKELELLGVHLKIPKEHYISYTETIELLKKNKVSITYGEDLTPEAEKKLGELYPDDMVFVHSWPLSLRAFYLMPQKEDPNAELSQGFDCIYKGLEITSGGQRIHLPELLIQRLKAKGLKPEQFKYYIDSFRYGAPPHAGWSIGLERLTMLICGLDNVKEATMFPRDRDRLEP